MPCIKRDQKNKAVLILGGASKKQLPNIIEQAKERDLKVVLFDKNYNINKISDYRDLSLHVIAIESYSSQEVIEKIRDQCSGNEFIYCMTLTDKAVTAAAAVSAFLGVKANDLDALSLIQNKYKCRQLLRHHGLIQPSSFICFSKEQARQTYSRVIGDAVIKPLDESGSYGVRVIQSVSELEAAFADFDYDCAKGFIIESYQRGVEYSVDGYVFDGRAKCFPVAKKFLFGGGSLVESAHVLPAKLSKNLVKKVQSSVEHVLSIVGIRFGHFHIEFWIDGEDLVFGEIHARPGGDYLHLLSQLASGVDYYGNLFDAYLGKESNLKFDVFSSSVVNTYAVGFLQAIAGEVISIECTQELNRLPNYVLADITVEVGDRVSEVKKSADRIGCVIAKGDDENEAMKSLAELMSSVKIITENKS